MVPGIKSISPVYSERGQRSVSEFTKRRDKNIKQQSHNADELINSFVDAFDGLTQSDQSKIKSSVTSLAKPR